MSEFKVGITTCYGAANTGQQAGTVATELVKENEDYHLICLPEEKERIKVGVKKRIEEELADRVAFSIRQVTPSIAVDGKLKYVGDAPELKDFLKELGLTPAGPMKAEGG